MSKPLLFVVLASVLGAFSFGCATKGPTFQALAPEPGKAIVYVYRPGNDMTGSGVVLKIKCDGQQFGALRNDGYVYTSVPPGRHVISCRTESTSEVPFDAVAGKSYFIEADVVMGLLVGRPRLKMVPEDAGRLAIAGCRYAAPKTETASAASAMR